MNEKELSLEQKKLSYELYLALKTLISTEGCMISRKEIYSGLGMSRTPLNGFFDYMEEMEKLIELQGGSIESTLESVSFQDIKNRVRTYKRNLKETLEVNQVQILRLFYAITKEKSSWTNTQRENRGKLGKEELNKLLRAARCQIIEESENIKVDEEVRHPQILRIASRLSDISISDTEIDNIFNLLLDRLFQALRGWQKESQKTQFLLEEAKQWKINSSFTETMQEKFQKALTSFSCAGKKVFSLEELFELRSNIKEREKLRIKPGDDFRIRIESCEFENLRSHSPALIKLLNDLQINPGILLGMSDDDFFNETSSVLISKIEGRFGNTDPVIWQFSSNHAHIDNSIKAVMKGMGCPLQLKKITASNLSDGTGSLARVSVTLIESKSKRTYHGLWVSQSVIIGVAQATVEAVSSWVFAMLPPEPKNELESHFQAFKHVSCEYSNLDRSIRKLLNLVNNYDLLNPEASLENQYARSDETSIPELETSIQELRRTIYRICNSNASLDIVYNQYMNEINMQESVLIWMKMRLCRNRWDLKNFEDCLNKAKDVSTKIPSPIEVLFESERMIFQFIDGNEEFLRGKLWRKDRSSILEQSLSKLRQFTEGFDLNYRVHDDLSYLATSEILGTVSRLDLYFCDHNDKDILNDAAQRFMMAAHFACKIGLRQKAARWLAFASRCYTRLKNSNRSKECYNVALDIVAPTIEARFDSRYKDAILAGMNLARGELALLEREHEKAGQFFCNGLVGALYIGFTRLSADCLFGLSRVQTEIEASSLDKIKKFLFAFPKGTHGEYVEGLLEKLHEYVNHPEVKDSQEFFRDLARNSVWNSGRTPGDRPHPIADAIDSGSFLSILR